MEKYFNVTGACNPTKHYMVNLIPRLEKIKHMVERGEYFSINRARQFGKTTTLSALCRYLNNDYIVIYIDFQAFSYEDFITEASFVKSFVNIIISDNVELERISGKIIEKLKALLIGGHLSKLFNVISEWCDTSSYPVVLAIDEADSASNYDVFVSFLAQLRAYFNARATKGKATFQSVILAGVLDIKNLKLKIYSKDNSDTGIGIMSPWNIATDFRIDMSFSVNDIKGMLEEYENDYKTGMDSDGISLLIYEYTSGYPFLVSKICQVVEEILSSDDRFSDREHSWTKEGIVTAVKMIQSENNSLFESLTSKLYDYPDMRHLLYRLFFNGEEIPYAVGQYESEIAIMFGFCKVEDGKLIVANRIFETLLYNLFLTDTESKKAAIYKSALSDKNQFVIDGHLDMELILKKFTQHFTELYGNEDDKFIEDIGRKHFLLYLRPIINGVGNYYIETQTRDLKRTDVIVDYLGEQFVIEMKIWHGQSRHSDGEKQLIDYLDYYKLDKGYLLSFNFNKKKEVGVRSIKIGSKIVVEATV